MHLYFNALQWVAVAEALTRIMGDCVIVLTQKHPVVFVEATNPIAL
jgi:hypothetical protein